MPIYLPVRGGTGKTSMAKIFARYQLRAGRPTDHPVTSVVLCKSILSGQSMDVLEIDAASKSRYR